LLALRGELSDWFFFSRQGAKLAKELIS